MAFQPPADFIGFMQFPVPAAHRANFDFNSVVPALQVREVVEGCGTADLNANSHCPETRVGSEGIQEEGLVIRVD